MENLRDASAACVRNAATDRSVPTLDPVVRDQLTRLIPPVSEAETLPPACYRDPDVLAIENAMLFRRGWVSCGRSDRLQRAGDYIAVDIGAVPVIVLRDDTGNLRAFANSCRHRGTRLLTGSGNAGHIRCPFHAWIYGLDGSLVAASRMDTANGFDRSDYGLIEFRTAELAGFTFVCLDRETADLDQWMDQFVTIHAPWTLADLVTARRRELEVACNWKLFLEVFNEYYHLPFVHGRTFGKIYREPDPPEPVSGAFTTQFGLTSGTGGLKSDEQEFALPVIPGLGGPERNGTRYTWIFPTVTFAAGSEAMWVYETWPITVDRCRVAMSVCFPPQTLAAPDFEKRAAHYYRRMDEALEEDIVVLEEQQAGMASPWAARGRFSSLEPSVANFAFWYAARMVV